MAIAVLVLGTVTVFLTLCVLGSMRETVLLRAEVEALSQLITSPPLPSFVGGAVPVPLRRALEDAGSLASREGSVIVAFVTPGCGPCDELVTAVSEAVDRQELQPQDLFFVIWARKSTAARRFAAKVPVPTVIDGDGELARRSEIRATPTFLAISRNDLRVDGVNLEGGVEWILERLAPETVAALDSR